MSGKDFHSHNLFSNSIVSRMHSHIVTCYNARAEKKNTHTLNSLILSYSTLEIKLKSISFFHCMKTPIILEFICAHDDIWIEYMFFTFFIRMFSHLKTWVFVCVVYVTCMLNKWPKRSWIRIFIVNCWIFAVYESHLHKIILKPFFFFFGPQNCTLEIKCTYGIY